MLWCKARPCDRQKSCTLGLIETATLIIAEINLIDGALPWLYLSLLEPYREFSGKLTVISHQLASDRYKRPPHTEEQSDTRDWEAMHVYSRRGIENLHSLIKTSQMTTY